jgi:drug/metabolite transporter (DMT)-like permease
MEPPAEHVHWLFATGFLLLGLFLLARAVVGEEVWNRRRWRAYLWPSLLFALGLLMWPVMVFFTNSTIHMVAHGAWAQTMMLAGAAELGLARGKLRHRAWRLALPLCFAVSGIAILVHEQNGWFFARAAFLHHALGYTALIGALFPLALVVRPRSRALGSGLALTLVVLAVFLYADRDVAPIFGHLSPLAGERHR